MARLGNSTNRLRPAAALLVAGFLSACQTGSAPSQPSPPSPGSTIAYECDGGLRFDAEFDDSGDQVLVNLEGRRFILPRTPADTGGEYSNGQISLFTRDEEAYLEQDGYATHTGCIGYADN